MAEVMQLHEGHPQGRACCSSQGPPSNGEMEAHNELIVTKPREVVLVQAQGHKSAMISPSFAPNVLSDKQEFVVKNKDVPVNVHLEDRHGGSVYMAKERQRCSIDGKQQVCAEMIPLSKVLRRHTRVMKKLLRSRSLHRISSETELEKMRSAIETLTASVDRVLQSNLSFLKEIANCSAQMLSCIRTNTASLHTLTSLLKVQETEYNLLKLSLPGEEKRASFVNTMATPSGTMHTVPATAN